MSIAGLKPKTSWLPAQIFNYGSGVAHFQNNTSMRMPQWTALVCLHTSDKGRDWGREMNSPWTECAHWFSVCASVSAFMTDSCHSSFICVSSLFLYLTLCIDYSSSADTLESPERWLPWHYTDRSTLRLHSSCDRRVQWSVMVRCTASVGSDNSYMCIQIACNLTWWN